MSSDLKVLPASLEVLDHLDYLESLDSLDQLDSKVTVVSQEALVFLEFREKSVLPVTLVHLVSLVGPVLQDKQVSLDHQEPLVLKDLRVLRVTKAGLVIQGSLDSLETLVLLVLVDQVDRMEIKDYKVSRVWLELSAPLDKQVGYTVTFEVLLKLLAVTGYFKQGPK